MVFHLDPTGMSALSLAAQGGHFDVRRRRRRRKWRRRRSGGGGGGGGGGDWVVDLLLRVKVPANSEADVNGRSKAGGDEEGRAGGCPV
eukprot:749125-Hanusia_phi.AAC.4